MHCYQSLHDNELVIPSRQRLKLEYHLGNRSDSPEAQAWNLAMFGNNRLFAFCISSRGIDEILPGWELASGLAFSESKMAALKSIFLNNSRSKGNRMLNHVSVIHYSVMKSSIMIILDHLVSS